MKKWFWYLCLLVFPVFFACSDDKEEGEDEKLILTVDKEKLEFEAGTTESFMERVRVTTNAEDWTVVAEMEGEEKWFTVTKMDRQWLEVVASVNHSLEKREGKLLIKAEGCPDKVIPVLQSAAAEATLELSKNVIVFDKAGGDEKITITSNQATIRLEEVEEADWFEVSLAEDNKSFSVKVEKTEKSEVNVTTFKVIAGVEGNQKEIEVTVKQVDAVVLNASGYRVVLDAPDGITIVKSSESWCTAELNAGKLLIGASGNVGGTTRSATVTLGEDVVINVEQEGGEFKPGDIFKHNGVAVGVVVSHDEDGLLIIALEEREMQFCAKIPHSILEMGFDPIYNKAKEGYEDWKDVFPVFAYCAEMDEQTGMEGWCLPSFWRLKSLFGDELEGHLNSEWPKMKANQEAVNNALQTLKVPTYHTGWYWCDAAEDGTWGYAWNLAGTPDMSGRCMSKRSDNLNLARCFWWKRDLVK